MAAAPHVSDHVLQSTFVDYMARAPLRVPASAESRARDSKLDDDGSVPGYVEKRAIPDFHKPVPFAA